MRSCGLRPIVFAQVRPHGKPGQVGEPGAPVRFLWVLLMNPGFGPQPRTLHRRDQNEVLRVSMEGNL